MNPVREEEETEAVPWRTKNTNTRVKSITSIERSKPGTLSTKKKNQLTLSKPNSNLGRDQIDQILEDYNFQALHDRIMRKILD